MVIESWHENADHIVLSIGDMIVDVATGQIGVLISRQHRITYEDDDLYFWQVQWSKYTTSIEDAPNSLWMEEQGLKISIFVGFYDLYNV